MVGTTLDNNNKRKGSWDSKMSVSSVSTRPYFTRSETPSSILSSDSDIRFTRKIGDHYRCGCCILAAFLVFVLIGTLSLYAAYTYLSIEPGGERIFRGVFRVVEGDKYLTPLADPGTDLFKRISREYREGLNLVYKRSSYRPSYLRSEILALDGIEGEDLVVHFNLLFNPHYQDVLADELESILANSNQSSHLGNRTIDLRSIHIYESSPSLSSLSSTSSATSSTKPPMTTTPLPPRMCTSLQLKYCSTLPYNITSYPNVIGHKSINEVNEDVISFRELVDAECHRMAFQFVCQVLQPPCVSDYEGASIIVPCRDFCEDFMSGCGNRLPARFKESLDCKRFPESSTIGERCTSKPGCKESLEARGLETRICDGVPDCVDMSDELSCDYCPTGYIHCGSGKTCIPVEKKCNGEIDCPNHSDEKSCLGLAPSISSMSALASSQPMHSVAEGHVVFNEKSTLGKLCLDNLNETISEENRTMTLLNVATSLCRTLLFEKVDDMKVEVDDELKVKNYVQMDDPSATQITFVQSPCPNRTVLLVKCTDIECGLQSARITLGLNGLTKVAAHGDWPWHAALLKDGVHVCDATMVASQWLLTSASCFQGQQKAEWVARLGSVRLTSTSPWQQQRHIVGMVKSPVEGSTMVLVKLDSPLATSDFVRPVCLPQQSSMASYSTCNTLGWAYNREVLQRVELQESKMEQCANISITTVNSLCSESRYSMDDCSEEELAGSPMLCLNPEKNKWVLTGITNWRIACAKNGAQRPRLYDKTASNIDWIRSTIQDGK